MAPGFSQARLDELEDVIMKSGVEAFLQKLESKYADRDVVCNLFIEFHCLAMDTLRELAYGKCFNMIQSQSHPFTNWLRVCSNLYAYIQVVLSNLASLNTATTNIDIFGKASIALR
jgi:hypothetical protein